MWAAATHFKQATKKFRPYLKKNVLLGNTSGSGEEKKNLLPGNSPNNDLLAIQETCFSGLLVVNTLTMQAMWGV